MSCYLTVRKKGVELCSFSRNTEFYEALNHGVKFGDWCSCDIDDLRCGCEQLQNEINDYKHQIENENKALQFLHDRENVYCAIDRIDFLEGEIENKVEVLIYIKFLMHVWHQGDEGEMEWMLG